MSNDTVEMRGDGRMTTMSKCDKVWIVRRYVVRGGRIDRPAIANGKRHELTFGSVEEAMVAAFDWVRDSYGESDD
jgi:hypothetical protein